jgi:hypothetical protein
VVQAATILLTAQNAIPPPVARRSHVVRDPSPLRTWAPAPRLCADQEVLRTLKHSSAPVEPVEGDSHPAPSPASQPARATPRVNEQLRTVHNSRAAARRGASRISERARLGHRPAGLVECARHREPIQPLPPPRRMRSAADRPARLPHGRGAALDLTRIEPEKTTVCTPRPEEQPSEEASGARSCVHRAGHSPEAPTAHALAPGSPHRDSWTGPTEPGARSRTPRKPGPPAAPGAAISQSNRMPQSNLIRV